jgi:DNA replication and repair protein RecF
MTFIRALQLTNFRNFESFSVDFSPGVSLIIGPNGAGKTNILEAVSNLAPGRGIRGASGVDMCKINTNGWHISANLDSNLGPAHLNLGYDASTKRKHLTFNDRKITLNELGNFTSAIWLTPQMDGIFASSSSERRRFLDRLVFAHFRNHASLVTSYEKLQRERMDILERSNDHSWLSIIESNMAGFTVDINRNRIATIALLNEHIKNIDTTFPKASLILESPFIEFVDDRDAIADIFKNYRIQDKESGKTHVGANKADFAALYGSDNIPAYYCSTGQQKSLLISIIMAHQIAISSKDSIMPILLLDEIFVHLDDVKRAALAEFLLVNKAQVLITSTESEVKLLLQNPNIVDFS